MTERRKKAPKIAWRDLMKESDAPAAPPAATPAPAEPPVSATPVPAAPVSEVASPAPAPPAAPISAAAEHAAPAPGAARAPAAVAATPEEDASSPSALAARLDEAYTAMMAEQGGERAREQAREQAPAKALQPAPDAARLAHPGPPPDTNIASARAASTTIPARQESPASTPAATPEAEVQRILARLATWVPVARAAAAAPSAEADAPALVAPRGPAPLDDEDAAPLIAPAGLRDAARTRRGRVELLLFRAGGELFALPLGAVEEAIEAPSIHSLPEMPSAMLGVFNLRERLVPTYSPGPSLGVGLAEPAGAALLVRSGDRRLALAADDVEDVMELDLATLRDPPVVEDTDGILLGVARFGRDLVGILDADALISACLGGRNVENP